MKKYYLHNGTESSGPFDIEELKAKNITKTSPVWFDGMLHWKTAGEIPELNQLFTVNPPAFPLFETPELATKVETNKEARKILGLSKNAFLIVCATVVILIGISVLKTIEENRSRELKIKNHKTEIENYQLELKQKQLEEEKIQAVIQEQIDARRMATTKKETASNRLTKIEQLIVEYQNNLDETEKKLQKAAGFKLLRSASEKKKQMDFLQKNIDSYKNIINKLKNESDQLKLEMEKIPK
ncbi:DUF4339 domain-containing protein [Flavobacterium franklandianum]|uniref:GYF domain-containing protein n=1 Tax=Flavobacterium franklandianum TaxID=2594430 RepID=UPI00117A0F6B|nr:GYF domain-containing protein [Flavobacterium franklandianum]TRX24310.1 DUF4339 domain-containing protein [Flavobacterium franklandianum]